MVRGLACGFLVLTVAACAGIDAQHAPARKQVYALTAADLTRAAVWEFPLDESGGSDEETVESRPRVHGVDPRAGIFVVRARFVAHDGRRYDGFFTASTRGVLEDMQPTIVVGRAHVAFWFGIVPPRRAEIARAYALLASDARRLFPLRFASAVRIAPGPSTGVVRGFGHYDRAQRERLTR